MTDKTTTETAAQVPQKREILDVNWTRVEGILGVGALLTSFIWFLGMPTGMAIGVGFGLVLLLDFIRAQIFETSRSDRTQPSTRELARH